MTSPVEELSEPEVGLTRSQRDNVATFSSINPPQLVHVMGSFLRLLAVLSHGIAEVLEETLNGQKQRVRDDDVDESHMM